MEPYFKDATVTVHHGDCLDVLRDLPDCSVDSVCCDPPYGLANTDPAHVAETIMRWVNGERDYLPGGAGFMGKAWDAFVPPVAVWDECLRVLKPGGHVLAFAGSRTVDLMTLGLRLAGFDIRDSIAWLYGSGFPKSLDVSKAIDKAGGDTGQRVFRTELKDAIAASGLTFADIDRALGVKSTSCYWVRDDHRACLPAPRHWAALGEMLPLSDDLQALYIECERADREVSGPAANEVYSPSVRVLNAGTPSSGAAERWSGWGTALKPAFEPIVLARKPLVGTVAANVLAHGTGALNIDACRIGTEPAFVARRGGVSSGGIMNDTDGERVTSGGLGRWPANVVLDEHQAAELDAQSGVSQSRVGKPRGAAAGDGWGMTATGAEYDDLGGASRFFYVAKADQAERVRIDGVAHPTVKPLALMRWLVRLVTPPGGVVLEPFAGSGTTVEACILEGFHCIAIEREETYLPLIRQRIARRRDPVQALRGAGEDGGLFDLLDDRPEGAA